MRQNVLGYNVQRCEARVCCAGGVATCIKNVCLFHEVSGWCTIKASQEDLLFVCIL